MSRRPIASIALICLAALCGGLLLSGCTPKVRVETGEIITCTYGEVIKDTVKVVEVPADQAGKYTVVEKTETCPKHQKLQDLYDQAQDAIVSNQLEQAAALLAQITKQEAAFRKAQAQLDAIKSGKTPAVDTGSPDSAGGDGKVPIGPVANIANWVPDTLPGYVGAAPVADVYSISRDYVPQPGATADTLVIAVEQFKDAAAAKANIKTSLASSYSYDADTISIVGRSARFGTDGRRFATLAWTEGGVLVVIEASSAKKPATLKTLLTELASQLIK